MLVSQCDYRVDELGRTRTGPFIQMNCHNCSVRDPDSARQIALDRGIYLDARQVTLGKSSFRCILVLRLLLSSRGSGRSWVEPISTLSIGMIKTSVSGTLEDPV
jgi:hypothetical protein